MDKYNTVPGYMVHERANPLISILAFLSCVVAIHNWPQKGLLQPSATHK